MQKEAEGARCAPRAAAAGVLPPRTFGARKQDFSAHPDLGKFPEVVRWISIERDLVDRAGSTTSNRLATIDSIELGSVRSIDDLKTIWVDLADRPPARPLLIDLGPIEPDRA